MLRLKSALQLWPVVADGFDRAAFLGFFAASFFFGILRLLIDKGVTAVVIAFEIIRRGFAAEIAINALVIHVILAGDVLRIPVCDVSHKLLVTAKKSITAGTGAGNKIFFRNGDFQLPFSPRCEI